MTLSKHVQGTKLNQGYAFPELLYIVNGSIFPLTFQTKKQ